MSRRPNQSGKGRITKTSFDGKSSVEGRQSLTPTERARLHNARRKMKVRIDGEDQEISAAEVVLSKSFQAAIAGSPHAQGQYLRSLQAAEEIEARNIKSNIAIGWRIKHDAGLRLEQLIAKGKKAKHMLIHPDDVEITEGIGFTIKGPVVQEELDALLLSCRRRDIFLKQAVLELRLAATEAGPDASPEAATEANVDADAETRVETSVVAHRQTAAAGSIHDCDHDRSSFDQLGFDGDEYNRAAFEAFEQRADAGAMFMAFYMENGLPERFKLSNDDMIQMQSAMDELTKRELLKEMHTLWAKIGTPKPRGWRLPPLAIILRTVEVMTPLVMDVFACAESGQHLSLHQIAKRLMGVDPRLRKST